MKKLDDPPLPGLNDKLDILNKMVEEIKMKNYAFEKQVQEGIKPVNVRKSLSFNERFLDLRFRAKKSILVNMELITGDHVHFIAVINDECFKWHMRTYVVDASFRYYDITYALWCLDYHEELSLPVQRKINASAIKKGMVTDEEQDIDMALNPTTLRLFIESQVIQKVIKGADLDKVMEFMKRLLILILVVTAVTFLIILKGSGMLNSIHIPWLH